MDTIQWCGYEWKSSMEGDRIIDPKTPWMWYCQNCSYVDIYGTLHLCIEQEPNTVEYWDGTVYKPTKAVGLLRTVEDFGYGTFSIDVQLPEGYNLWPSFWITGSEKWPPEIDIVEAWSGKDSYFRMFTRKFPWLNPGWRTTTNVYYVSDSGTVKKTGSENISVFKQCKNPMTNFINYKCEWLPDTIRFYAGGKLVREIKGDVPRMLTENIPDGKYRMNAVVNLCCEDPETHDVSMSHEMLARNFIYVPFNG